MKQKFTEAEIGHLLTLISINERDGWYFAPAEQYWKRSQRIKQKLQNETEKP